MGHPLSGVFFPARRKTRWSRPIAFRREKHVRMYTRLLVAVSMFAVSLCAPVQAAPVLIDFDALGDGDGDAVTNQFAGVMFSNATVLTAGLSLNELDYPPRSGSNVVYDNGAPITI